MKKKVFISGSISIKNIPNRILSTLDNIINQKLDILIGDADGIDALIQNYFKEKKYYNLTVYTINDTPRQIKSKEFKTEKIDVKSESNKERERQQEKDAAMTIDSDYSFIIWDGKSKGSYNNIIRSLKNKQPIKVYLSQNNDFIQKNKLSINEIEAIYRDNNGYSAKEIIELLNIESLPTPQSLYKYLVDKDIIKKENSIYLPKDINSIMFIIESYKGVNTRIKFTDNFIDWIEEEKRKDERQETFVFPQTDD